MDDNLVQIFQFLLAIGFFSFLLNFLNSRYNDYLTLNKIIAFPSWENLLRVGLGILTHLIL